jgi:hypothetical protein
MPQMMEHYHDGDGSGLGVAGDGGGHSVRGERREVREVAG